MANLCHTCRSRLFVSFKSSKRFAITTVGSMGGLGQVKLSAVNPEEHTHPLPHGKQDQCPPMETDEMTLRLDDHGSDCVGPGFAPLDFFFNRKKRNFSFTFKLHFAISN